METSTADIEKKELFERFLTYRRRMSRMCAMQAVYLYDMRQRSGVLEKNNRQTKQSEVSLVCKNLLYCYQNVFLSRQDYGSTKKNKKIDETYVFETVTNVVNDMEEIDELIGKYLNEKWTVQRLDSVVRSILRCAVCEIIYEEKTEIAVLTSEYTSIASHFFNGKEIGFINSIIDKIGKDKRKERANA